MLCLFDVFSEVEDLLLDKCPDLFIVNNMLLAARQGNDFEPGVVMEHMATTRCSAMKATSEWPHACTFELIASTIATP